MKTEKTDPGRAPTTALSEAQDSLMRVLRAYRGEVTAAQQAQEWATGRLPAANMDAEARVRCIRLGTVEQLEARIAALEARQAGKLLNAGA